MKKWKKYLIIAFVSLLLLYLIISVTMVVIEEYIEANIYHLLVYNYTNDEIEITVNNKYIINVESRTYFWDKVFYDKALNKDNKYHNNYYLIKSNGNIIFNKEMDNAIGSFSASGGALTNIVINKTDENNYDIIFTMQESEIGNWLELKKVRKSKWWMDFLNSDGLDQ